MFILADIKPILYMFPTPGGLFLLKLRILWTHQTQFSDIANTSPAGDASTYSDISRWIDHPDPQYTLNPPDPGSVERHSTQSLWNKRAPGVDPWCIAWINSNVPNTRWVVHPDPQYTPDPPDPVQLCLFYRNCERPLAWIPGVLYTRRGSLVFCLNK